MSELRVYLLIESLRRQFAAYMASPTRARGYVPIEGMHSLIIEMAPALAIHRVMDLAVKSVPEAEPGMLYVERQFGILELHDENLERLKRAGQAVLEGIGAKAADQLKPQVLYRHRRGRHRSARGDPQPQSRSLHDTARREPAARRDRAGTVRRGGGERGGEGGTFCDARRLPDDRRVGPPVHIGRA